MTDNLPVKHSLLQLIRFGAVGALSTIVHAIVYIFVLHTSPASGQEANIVGFIFAFSFSFIGQNAFTFKKKGVDSQIFMKFAIVSFCGLALNSFWVYLVEHVFDIDNVYAAIGIALVTPGVTFISMKFWVFKN